MPDEEKDTPVSPVKEDDTDLNKNSKNETKSSYEAFVKEYLNQLFTNKQDRKEAEYVVAGAIIVALNTGFVNGVTLSEFFLAKSASEGVAAVAGTGGAFSRSAMFLVDWNFEIYRKTTLLVLSYMLGSFVVALITPRAHKHVIEPTYGPTFFIGGFCLTAASIFASYGLPSRFIFYLATASLGLQNGIASIYSANLIRCTMTGAHTDIGLIVAQICRGNYERLIRGTLIALIVLCFWLGSILSVPVVRNLHEHALYISAISFYALGLLCVRYSIHELQVALRDAIFGTWDWKTALGNLRMDEKMTETDLMDLFDSMDVNGDGRINSEELRRGLQKSKSFELTDFRLKVIMRAADVDLDNHIDRAEWQILVGKIIQYK